MKVDRNRKISQGPLGVKFGKNILRVGYERVLARRDSVVPGVRFPRIKLLAISHGFHHSDHVRNIFLLNGEVQVRVFAAYEASICNAAEYGPFVGDDQNLGSLEKLMQTEQFP